MQRTHFCQPLLLSSLLAVTLTGAACPSDPTPNVDAGDNDDAGEDSGIVPLPEEDAGEVDSGTPPDAGEPDAGQPDAGQPDAGEPDAGEVDSGIVTPDAGQPDAGEPDAGEVDSGIVTPDAGEVDSGVIDDAGQPDAGEIDAGLPDAGEIDAGLPDAGDPDAGEVDAGAPDAGDVDSGVIVDAGDPDAGEVDAGDADAGEVDAGDPDAGTPVDNDIGDLTNPFPITLPSALVTNIADIDDLDCYTFTISEDLIFTANTSSDGAGSCDEATDTFIELFDMTDPNNPVSVVSNDDIRFNGVNNNLCSTLALGLFAGDYALCVAAAPLGVVESIDTVHLLLDGRPDEAGDVENPKFEPALPFTEVFDLVPAGEADCFSFDIEAAGTITARTSDGAGGCVGDTELFLFDDTGVDIFDALASNDDTDTNLCSELVFDIDAAGRYTVCGIFSTFVTTPQELVNVNLDVSFSEAPVDPVTPTLIISEVIDGNFAGIGNAKYVEIFNATNNDVSLNGFAIRRYANGATNFAAINLSNVTLAANTAYVVANNQNDFRAVFNNVAGAPTDADQYNTNINGNGDDVYELVDANGVRIDIFGEVSVDGTGQPWEYTDQVAKRQSTIVEGVTVWNAAEWTFAPANAAANLSPKVR